MSDTPQIVCSILERDVRSALARLEAVPRGCGLVEIRGDYLDAGDVAGLVRRLARFREWAPRGASAPLGRGGPA